MWSMWSTRRSRRFLWAELDLVEPGGPFSAVGAFAAGSVALVFQPLDEDASRFDVFVAAVGPGGVVVVEDFVRGPGIGVAEDAAGGEPVAWAGCLGAFGAGAVGAGGVEDGEGFAEAVAVPVGGAAD